VNLEERVRTNRWKRRWIGVFGGEERLLSCLCIRGRQEKEGSKMKTT